MRLISLIVSVLIFIEVGYSCEVRWTSDNAVLGSQTKQYPPMGRAMRSEFMFDEKFTSLNHGSYGTYPNAVRSALHEAQAKAESNPDLFLRRIVRNELSQVRQLLADLMGCESEDLVLIPNTTGGMNGIFRSLKFSQNERILHFNTIYGSMGSLIQYICDTSSSNVTRIVFNVTYPLSDDQLVVNFRTFLETNHDPSRPIKLALVDHITSVPGIILPIERIIPILKEYGILVLIDGAHAIGQVSINITQLDPDYYITNCHKWLYSPRGSAVMYVRKNLQRTVHPAHITSGYSDPADFQEEFFWTGTMDYSPYLAIPAALEFRRAIGGEDVVRSYTHNLALVGGAYLASRYGTRVLQSPRQMGNMVDVELPLNNPDHPTLTTNWWTDTLLLTYGRLYAPPYKHGGVWWVRHSAQIYNDMTDFQAAGDLFLEICQAVDNSNGNETVIIVP